MIKKTKNLKENLKNIKIKLKPPQEIKIKTKIKLQPKPQPQTAEIINIKKHMPLIDKIKKSFSKANNLFIIMLQTNGYYDFLLVNASKNNFSYHKKTYLIDTNSFFWIDKLQSYGATYHEDLSIPFKIKISVDDVYDSVQTAEPQIINSLNPFIVKRFLESKVAEGVMKGQMIDEFLKQIKVMLIITMLSSVIMLLLFISKTGMLKGIKMPFT